jgi:predicted nuclease with TOPRIM domain
MSNTPIQITTDLSKALEQINTKLDKIDDRLNKLEVGQARAEEKLSGQINTLDERLSGQIKALDEKVTGLSKRVDSVDFINRGVFVALIIAILGGFAKIFGFIGSNP